MKTHADWRKNQYDLPDDFKPGPIERSRIYERKFSGWDEVTFGLGSLLLLAGLTVCAGYLLFLVFGLLS